MSKIAVPSGAAYARVLQTAVRASTLRELTVFDAGSANLHTLVDKARTRVHPIHPNDDPLVSMTVALGGKRLDMLHVVAHGQDGRIWIGGRWLGHQELFDAAAVLATWNVDTIALWSCGAGMGAFGHVLSTLTGARVLASAQPLGKVGDGYNWKLKDQEDYLLPHTFSAPFNSGVMQRWNHSLAKLSFVNAYQVNTATTQAGKEANSVDFSTAALNVVRIDDRSGGINFSGNDVVVEAEINGSTYYGWISRPIKSNGVVRGYYFWTDPQFTSLAQATADGNADGDGNAADNLGFVLVVDQAWFNAQPPLSGGLLKNVGTSSDRVDAGLNALVAVNSAPALLNDAATALEDGGALGGNVLANDSDANLDALTVTGFSIGGVAGIIGQPTAISGIGSFTLQANGSYSFTPVANYAGPAPLITYTASDGRGGTASANLSLAVTRVNDAPAGADRTITTSENTAHTFTAADFGFTDAGDSPANGLAGVRITTLPGNGSLTLNGVAVVAGSEIALADITRLKFTPAANGAGSGYASFTFQVRDNGGSANGGVDLDQSPNTITFDVVNVNSAPTAAADTLTATSGTPATGSVLANDSDGDAGDTITVATAAGTGNAAAVTTNTVIAGAHGDLTLSNNGIYSYSANANAAAVKALAAGATLADTFSYTIKDAAGLTSTASISVTVAGVNDAIDAADDFAFAVASTLNSARINPSGNVLNNDSDPDSGDTMTVTRASAGGSLGGTIVTIGTSGAASGTESRAYTAFETQGAGNLSVGAAVTGAGVPPGTTVQSVVNNSGTRTVTFSNSYGNLVALDNMATITIGNNTVTVDGRVNPSATVIGLTATSGTFTVGLDVSGTGIQSNTKVSAVSSGGAVTFVTLDKPIVGAMGTDVQFSGGATSIAGTYGTLALQADGSYTYTFTAASPVTASDVFTYEVRDGSGAVSTAQVTVDITASNVAPPTAAGDALSVTEDAAPMTSNVLSNDFQSAGTKTVNAAWTPDASSMTAVTSGGVSLSGEYGTLTIAADGSYTYTADNANPAVNGLASGASLSEVFYYRMGSATDGYAAAALTITIQGANDAPAAAPDTATAREAEAVAGADATGNVLRNDADPDAGAALRIASAGTSSANGAVSASTTSANGLSIAGTHGTLTIGADGSYRYVVNDSAPAVQGLNSSATLTDTFTYQVSDGAATDTDTLTITVQGANDAPTVTVGAAPTIAENASGAIGGIGIADIDDTSIDVTLSVDEGVITIGSLGSATVGGGANGSASLTLSGSPSAINAALATLSYQGAQDYSGTDLLRITAVDSGGLVAAETVAINVAPDNRALTVSAPTVNEASPYAIFSVAGAAGQKITLDVGTTGASAGHAGPGSDFVGIVEYFDGSAWQSYTGAPAAIPAGGTMLVRIPLLNDILAEGGETFRLDAVNRAGTVSGANATIVDDGTGAIYDGTVTGGVANSVTTGLDDDRLLSVSSSTVNEASPYAMFQVTGASGQQVALSLANGNASNADHGAAIEYFDGAAWQTYSGAVTLPAGAVLIARVALVDDGVYEGPEVFGLVAANGSGRSFVGTATIVDDGTGLIYPGTLSGTAIDSTATGLNNDLAIAVTAHGPVNEGSAYAMFTVNATVGEVLELAIAGAGGTPATVSGFALEFSTDGATWTSYNASTQPVVPAGGAVFVRVDISSEQDSVLENAEGFALTAATASGAGASHSAQTAIVDNGTGARYTGAVATGTPVAATGTLDNDAVADTTAPTIAISASTATLSTGQTATITFTLSEASSTFSAGDITVSGGTLSNFTALSPTIYTATFIPAANSTANGVIQVASGVFGDAAGNQNADGADPDNTYTVSVNTTAADTTPPTVAITSSLASLGLNQTANITFTLSEPSSGFTVADVAVSGGVLSNFVAQSATVYSATFTPAANSTASGVIQVASGRFADAAGNQNADGADPDNTLTLSVNTQRVPLAPTVTIVEDADNNGTLSDQESQGAVDVLIGLPGNAAVGDTLTITHGPTTQSIVVTSAMLSAGSIPATVAAPAPGASLTVAAHLVTGNGVQGPAATDSATRANESGRPAPGVTIVEDLDNNGVLSRPELAGDVDVSISLPSGAVAGDTLVVTDGISTQRIALTDAIIASATVRASFAPPAPNQAIRVEAGIVSASGLEGARGSDSATRGSGVALAVTAITPDTGIVGDFITTENRLTFSGTAETGTLVDILLNGQKVGSAIAVNDRWTFDNSKLALPSGDNTVTIVNGSFPDDRSSALIKVFSAALDPATDDGASNTDQKTSIINPEFILRAENILSAGDTARLVAPDGHIAGSLRVEAGHVADGRIDVPTEELDDGQYTFIAQIVDANGNVKASQPVSVTIVTDRDGIMPSVELAANGGDFNKDGILDWKQNNVAQLPMASADDFAAGKAAPAASFGAIMAGSVATGGAGAVALDANAQLLDVAIGKPQAPLPARMLAASPVLQFSVTSAEGGALADMDAGRAGLQTRIVIDLPKGVNATAYMKFDRATGSWFKFNDDQRLDTFDNGATLLDTNRDGLVDRLVVTLTDGERGDADGLANGVIVDPGMLAVESSPVYSIRLNNGDRYYTTDAREAATVARGADNIFEGARFDSLGPEAGGVKLQTKWQPFTQDYWFGAATQADPYLCYELVPLASGFFAAAPANDAGQRFHLYQNAAGQTQLVTQAEAAGLKLAAQGFVDRGAQFSTTTASAFAFDAEGFLIANKDSAATKAFVQHLAQQFSSTSNPGYVEAVEQHYLEQVALVGVAHGSSATAAELNMVFGTNFI